VTQLIHLNGPTAVGKSTVAAMYADRHPGVLNLDIDHVVRLIGGWRDNFWTTLAAGRELAFSMLGTHLSAGHDVVMPQLVTNVDQARKFEAAAERASAEYREIALVADKRRILDHHIDEVLDSAGGPDLVARVHDHLTAYVELRPNCVVVHTDELDLAQTYEAVFGVPELR
jgi:cytidylate kinase